VREGGHARSRAMFGTAFGLRETHFVVECGHGAGWPVFRPRTTRRTSTLRHMRSAAILLFALSACASTPSEPVFHDDRYLRFGVDPDQEANAVIESQKERQYRLAQRLVGKHFTALGFMDRGGRSSAVRILTLRGIGVALDSRPQSALQAVTRYALIAPPIKDTHDADKDGFEEVFVEERTPNESCLRVYRIRDVGAVDRVVVDAQVLGQRVCPRSAIDLDGDGVVELWTEVDLRGFPIVGAAAPRLSLPLWADQHRFVARAGTQAQRAWVAGERVQREAALQRARAQLDVGTCYVLAVELAALVYLERGDPTAQLAAFDRALTGLVLSPPQAAAGSKARARIYTDWNVPEPPPPAQAYADLSAKSSKQTVEHASSAHASTPSKSGRPSELALQRALALGAQHAAPAPAKARLDEPVLADGEFVITPQSAAEYAAARRGTRPRAVAVETARPLEPSGPLPSVDERNAYRAAARELAKAAVAERMLAADARKAAAEERREAQAARENALKAPDAATASEIRMTVAQHVEAASRYSEEANGHAAASAMHRDALVEHKALLRRMFGHPDVPDDAQ